MLSGSGSGKRGKRQGTSAAGAPAAAAEEEAAAWGGEEVKQGSSLGPGSCSRSQGSTQRSSVAVQPLGEVHGQPRFSTSSLASTLEKKCVSNICFVLRVLNQSAHAAASRASSAYRKGSSALPKL
jgi:hypothetical protein